MAHTSGVWTTHLHGSGGGSSAITWASHQVTTAALRLNQVLNESREINFRNKFPVGKFISQALTTPINIMSMSIVITRNYSLVRFFKTFFLVAFSPMRCLH